MSVITKTPDALEVLSDHIIKSGADRHYVLANIEQILGKYLRSSLPQSIKIKWPDAFKSAPDNVFLDQLTKYCKARQCYSIAHVLDNVEGWGQARGSKNWHERAKRWYVGRGREILGLAWLSVYGKFALVPVDRETDLYNTIPVHLSSLDLSQEVEYEGRNLRLLDPAVLKTRNLCQEVLLEGSGLGTGSSPYIIERTKDRQGEPSPYFINTNSFSLTESTTMTTKAITIPSAFTAAVEQNKEALQLAAKLSVGKTANAFLVDALTSKLPWYAKLFGQKQALKDNPLTKVATAQLANLLAQHFAQGNTKVTYVAEAMLQEAMVDLITNADVVNDLITKLGSFAGDLTGDSVK